MDSPADSSDRTMRTWSKADMIEIEQRYQRWCAACTPSSAELADDRFILFFLDAIRVAAMRTDDVILCDSLLIELFLCDDALREQRAIAEYQNIFAAAREGSGSRAKLVIVPFHRVLGTSAHWSLLVYHASSNSWFHYDSIPGSSHRELAVAFLARLASLGLITRSSDAAQLRGELDNTPVIGVQEGSWECGYFTLMFAFALIYRRDDTPLNPARDGPQCSQAYMQGKFRAILGAIIRVYKQMRKL